MFRTSTALTLVGATSKRIYFAPLPPGSIVRGVLFNVAGGTMGVANVYQVGIAAFSQKPADSEAGFQGGEQLILDDGVNTGGWPNGSSSQVLQGGDLVATIPLAMPPVSDYPVIGVQLETAGVGGIVGVALVVELDFTRRRQ